MALSYPRPLIRGMDLLHLLIDVFPKQIFAKELLQDTIHTGRSVESRKFVFNSKDGKRAIFRLGKGELRVFAK
jgi:hypothetical protein